MNDESKKMSTPVKIFLVIIAIAAFASIFSAFSEDENKNNSQMNMTVAKPYVLPLSINAKKIKQQHPNWINEDCNIIAKKEIAIGFNADQVIAAWGKPYKITETAMSTDIHEQWIMRENGSTYLYFVNGRLKSIQQSK